MKSTKIIRKLREGSLVKPMDIERISRSIAEAKNNQDFYVSHATLFDIENGSVPSIFKIFSLAVCLKVPYEQLLLRFGVDPQQVGHFGASEGRQTELEPVDLRVTQRRFELHFDRRINTEETNLLEGNVPDLAVPDSLQRRLDPGRFRYALIGREDDSMSDIIPPGTLVEIDREQRKIESFGWTRLAERPLYLVLHELGYSCCWCQQDGNELFLLPHPASGYPVRRYKIPGQATIIGRVVHAWVMLGPAQ
jgi:hypothetical protein